MDVLNSAPEARETAVKIWDVRGVGHKPAFEGALAIVQQVWDLSHPCLRFMIFSQSQESKGKNWEIPEEAPTLNGILPVPPSWDFKVDRPVVVLWQGQKTPQN